MLVDIAGRLDFHQLADDDAAAADTVMSKYRAFQSHKAVKLLITDISFNITAKTLAVILALTKLN